MGSIISSGQQQASSDQSASQGAQAGMLNGLLSKKRDGVDTGNLFIDNQYQDRNNQAARDSLYNAMSYQGSKDALDPLQSSRTATSEVQNNGILGKTFGTGGTLDRTTAEEQNLANSGYSLKPEDQQAYGQAQDQIARDFGASDNSLGQALSNRGLGNSSMAGAAFAGQQGNKNEMLAQQQRGIAQQRMQMNMERLGQTRQFLSQLTGQGANDIQQQYGRQLGSEQQNFNETMGKAQQGMGFLNAAQGQSNEQMSQRQQSAGVDTRGGIFGNMASGYFNGQVAGRSGGGGGFGAPTSAAGSSGQAMAPSGDGGAQYGTTYTPQGKARGGMAGGAGDAGGAGLFGSMLS